MTRTLDDDDRRGARLGRCAQSFITSGVGLVIAALCYL